MGKTGPARAYRKRRLPWLQEVGCSSEAKHRLVTDFKTGKAAVAALMQSKDTKELRLPQLKSMVLQMMKEGQRFTAKEINRIAGFNDARKFISDLRRHLSDYLVRDTRLNTGCKLYWLEPINTKPTLFSGQEAVSHE